MKRIFALLLVLCMIFAVAACGKSDSSEEKTTTTADTNKTGDTTIDWEQLADEDLIGAWKPTDPEEGEFYILFTVEKTMRLVYGTITFDSDVFYGIDGQGTKSAFTDGMYLYGQWTYVVDDDTLTVQYPVYGEDNTITEIEEKVYKKANYTPITLQAEEGFVAEESLIGKWTNSTYNDYYSFTEDGYAVYSCDFDDGVNVYTTEVKYTYTVNDSEIILSYYNLDGEKLSETFEYSIDGTKLLIGESDYYLNGEGEPVTEAAAE